MEASTSAPVAANLVRVSFATLADAAADLSAPIAAAFGPDGLGIILVDDVPGYAEARGALLPLASALAALPADQLARLEDAASHWNFGWSHGKERLEGDRPGACQLRACARCVVTSTDPRAPTRGAAPRADTAKGSFYANPLLDAPTDDEALVAKCVRPWLRLPPKSARLTAPRRAPARTRPFPRTPRRYPHFCRPNVWPHDALPALEPALKALGKLMTDVGLLLARHCDAYVAAHAGAPDAARMHRTIAESRCVHGWVSLYACACSAMTVLSLVWRASCVKSRLLHYFPLSQQAAAVQDVSSWRVCARVYDLTCADHVADSHACTYTRRCGWHLDHGSLTGLTCAQYMTASGQEVPPPDPAAGLYIRARDGRVLRAAFSPHQLAFQMGEATQIHSGGLLRATPHCVRAAAGAAAAGVARNTFAVFMQPNFDAPMDAPPGADVGVRAWRPGMDFGDFAAAKLAGYH